MKVIKVDVEERRIGLSVRAYREEVERLEAEDGIVEHDLKVGRSTMADVINQEALLRNIGFEAESEPVPVAEPVADVDTVTEEVPEEVKAEVKAEETEVVEETETVEETKTEE